MVVIATVSIQGHKAHRLSPVARGVVSKPRFRACHDLGETKTRTEFTIAFVSEMQVLICNFRKFGLPRKNDVVQSRLFRADAFSLLVQMFISPSGTENRPHGKLFADSARSQLGTLARLSFDLPNQWNPSRSYPAAP